MNTEASECSLYLELAFGASSSPTLSISRAFAASLRFIFEGNRCGDTDTPESMGIEDGDQIDVKQAVEGGCYGVLSQQPCRS